MNDKIIKISGRIDSENAASAEQRILEQLAGAGDVVISLDASDLVYISSAGLRVILRLKKAYPKLKITNVNAEIYDIFDMTGFTEMMTVEKAYRVVSVEGCDVIGEGFNGKVYRIDKDNVVKTYKNADALAEIQHEREVAKLALILGVPTAISYDVVRVGDSYGSVFELLNARSFAKILAKEPDKFEWCVTEYVKMLKKIHSITVPEGRLPKIKDKTLKKISRMKDTLPDGLGDKLYGMVQAIPDTDHMVHGDFHTKNIVLAGDEVLVIDMDTLSTGHPIFDLYLMYNAYVGFYEFDHDAVLSFQGFDYDTSVRFWKACLSAYLGTKDEKKISETEDKIHCLSYAYMIDRDRRYNGVSANEDSHAGVFKAKLIDVLGRIDSLDFELSDIPKEAEKELETDAITDNLDVVTDFVNAHLDAAGCSLKTRSQIDLAVEEIFINIANYAYAPNTGKAVVRVDLKKDPDAVAITFSDRGIPYDPLKKPDPDVALAAEEREIGGLGIFLTKKVMDEVAYEYKNGQNILTMTKKL